MNGKKLRGGALIALTAMAAVAMAAVWASAGLASQAKALDDSGEEPIQETRVVGGVEYPVNQNGQTYGDEPYTVEGPVYEDLPDLVAVMVSDEDTGETFVGYMRKEDCEPFYGQFDRITNPEEALAWMEAGSPIDMRPIYASDGETQVGWWGGTNGVAKGTAI